jgi:hypothetical protein
VTAAGGVEIVPYAPELLPDLAQLAVHLLGPDVGANAAYLRWKHVDNPYLDGPCMAVAMHGERPVGMAGAVGARWQLGAGPSTLSAPCATTTVIHPDHRARGLLPALKGSVDEQLAAAGHRVELSTSAARAVQLSLRTAGWRLVGRFEWFRWRRSPTAGDRVRRRLAGGRRRPVAGRGPFALLDAARLPRGVTVSPRAAPDALAALAARGAGGGPLRHVRDETYFAWRFANPRADYRFVRADDAYLVLRARSTGRAMVTVADWAGDAARVAELLRHSLRSGVEVARVLALSLDAGDRRVLDEAGFTPFAPDDRDQSTRALLVRTLGGDPEALDLDGASLLDPATYGLRPLDLDDQ